jgi:16S rRNA pseudouridine516 synthase
MAVMAIFRIDKYLADMCGKTRSEVKAIIKMGRVSVDGVIVKAPDIKINTQVNAVCMDGIRVSYVDFEYFMLNKPKGVVSATQDKKDKTVLELIDEHIRNDLFPVGRLDKDTEGLLLITNDGMMAHNLLSPKKHVDKVYYVECDAHITDEMIKGFETGVELADGTITKPALLKVLDRNSDVPLCPLHQMPDSFSRAQITIHEGKFHQIKRMFEAFGMNVVYLKRLSMGNLVLDENLPCGSYRRLYENEIAMLKELV